MRAMAAEQAHGQGGYIGKALRRREDVRFVQGQGRYVDDIILPGVAWCAFVRSPHAHARIRALSTKAAALRPGVLLTLTAEDWAKAGHGERTVVHPMPFSDGRPMNAAPRPAFACGNVHHVGDIVAAVVADSRLAAEEAAAAAEVDYNPPAAGVAARAAVKPAAPLVHEHFGTNVVFEIERGNRQQTEAAMASAAKVVELDLTNNRLSANPIEPRSYLCDYDAASDRYTLYATSQQPHYLRRWLSVYTLHIPEPKLRVISPDVGGGFVAKGIFFHRGLHGRVGGANSMPADQVDRHANRNLPLRRASARSRHHRSHGFRSPRMHRCDADRYLGRAGGVSEQLRAQHSRQLLSADRHRPLQDAQPSFAGTGCLYQHGAGRR